MSEDFQRLEDWAAGLMGRMNAGQVRAVNSKVAQALRRSQAKRITQQRAPDGTAYPARKKKERLRGKRGRIKQRAMFLKIKATRHLRATATGQAGEVGFLGRVARIARVHQRGLADRPAPGMPDVRYTRRELLGFSSTDLDLIRDTLLKHLAGSAL